jgi:catechol 2,3-dioxygenase-like lactoylglutathione lyase family enzyme
MMIEHVALNVRQPREMAAWYVTHLGFRVLRAMEHEPWTHFLADDADGGVLEIYCNRRDAAPDYATFDPLRLHLAVVSQDPDADAARLIAAGASAAEEVRLADGTLLIMLRDPWGLSLQLCRRVQPMLPRHRA